MNLQTFDIETLDTFEYSVYNDLLQQCGNDKEAALRELVNITDERDRSDALQAVADYLSK